MLHPTYEFVIQHVHGLLKLSAEGAGSVVQLLQALLTGPVTPCSREWYVSDLLQARAKAATKAACNMVLSDQYASLTCIKPPEVLHSQSTQASGCDA